MIDRDPLQQTDMFQSGRRYALASPAMDSRHRAPHLHGKSSGASHFVDQFDGERGGKTFHHETLDAIFAFQMQAGKFDNRICDNRINVVRGGMDYLEIRSRLDAAEIKHKALGEFLGLEQSKLSKSLRGERKFTAEETDKIREFFNIQTGGVSLPQVPVIGLVPGGSWREAIQQPIGSIPRPDPEIPPRAFALKVRGDSMDHKVEDGGTVIVDPTDRDLFPGRYFVIMTADGESTFKRFFADPARLEPCSYNPAHKAILIGSEPFEVVGRVIWTASRL